MRSNTQQHHYGPGSRGSAACRSYRLRGRRRYAALRLALFVGSVVVPAAAFAGDTPETDHATYRDVRKVKVDAEMFDVEIDNGSGSVVTIDVTDIPQGFRVVRRERGGSVLVDIRGPNTSSSGAPGNPTVRVELPSETDLDIQSTSGDISIETIQGTVQVRTSSGDIRIKQGTGAFEIDSSSGGVWIQRYRGALRVQTSSGDIKVAELHPTGDIGMMSSSGDITIGLDNDPREITYVLRSSSGSLRFGTVTGVERLSGGEGPFRIDAATSSGDISIR